MSEILEEENIQELEPVTPKRRGRKKKEATLASEPITEAPGVEAQESEEVTAKPKRGRKKKTDAPATEALAEGAGSEVAESPKPKRRRRKKNLDADLTDMMEDVNQEDDLDSSSVTDDVDEISQADDDLNDTVDELANDLIMSDDDFVGDDDDDDEEDDEDDDEDDDEEYEESDRAAAQTAQGSLDDDDYETYIGVIRELLHKGKEKGYLSYSEIEKKIPKQIINTEILDNIYSMITEMGIDVVDDQQAANDFPDTQKVSKDEPDIDEISLSDPVRMYLREIGHVPLLTAADEIAIAKDIEKTKQEVFAKYGAEVTELFTEYKKEELIEKYKANEKRPLTEEVLLELQERAQEALSDPIVQKQINKNIEKALDARRDKQHDVKLLEANLRLVVSIAKKYIGRGLSFLDLIQEGNMGLIKAVVKFDHHKGFKFSTYATWWIRQAITRAIADQARTIRIPVHMVETINKMIRASRSLVQELGREPTSAEIAAKMGLSREKIEDIQRIAQEPVSLEKPIGEEEDSQLGDFLEDKDLPTPEQATSASILREQLEEMLNGITEREREVLRKRYCLESGKQQTLEEVGRFFGVTRERIRQIEGKALRKLRHPCKAKRLKDFLPS